MSGEKQEKEFVVEDLSIKAQKKYIKYVVALSGDRVNPADAFDPKSATDEQWVVFEKNVRHLAGDPNLDVGELYNIPHRRAPLGVSDSMNAAADATNEQINIRIKEIGEWLKKQNL